MPDTPESLSIAQQALKVAADAMAQQGEGRRAPADALSSGEFQLLVSGLLKHQREELPSAQFQGILLGIMNELRTDTREIRAEGRETRSRLEDVRVRLVEGDGRMGRIESQGLENAAHLGQLSQRLAAIERGDSSGIQRAIRSAVDDASRQSGRQQRPAIAIRRLRASVLIRLIGAAAAVATVAISGYFAVRQPQETASAIPKTAPAAP